jgi:hypothetical protein
MLTMAMRKITVYLPSELKSALEGLSQTSGQSEAELIREGIRQITRNCPAPKPQLPLFISGDPELADHVDEGLIGFGEH